jgi:uncharacterized membrane protein YqgA involved in biofilm formation
MKPASLRWIVDRNPFYMLSACCGLAGCWLLGDVSRPDLADVAMKVSAVFVYEIAVVVLAVWLAKRVATRRDATILSVLTLVLTADVSFFYTQAAMLNVVPAALFSAFGAAQALLIVGALLRGVRADLSRSAEWLLAMDLGAVHLFPLALRVSAEDREGLGLAFLAVFVAVGMVIAAHAVPSRWRLQPMPPAETLPRALGVVAPILILLSLMAHVTASEWIYEVPVFAVYGSPVLLGLAALCLRREAAAIERQEATFIAGGWACALSASAVILAFAKPPDGAVWDANGWSWLGISPMRLMLAGAAAVCWGQWRMRRGLGPITMASGALLLAILGHTPEAMRRNAGIAWRSVRDVVSAAVPASRYGWGALLFTLAFLLLGLGAWITWQRRNPEAPEQDR